MFGFRPKSTPEVPILGSTPARPSRQGLKRLRRITRIIMVVLPHRMQSALGYPVPANVGCSLSPGVFTRDSQHACFGKCVYCNVYIFILINLLIVSRYWIKASGYHVCSYLLHNWNVILSLNAKSINNLSFGKLVLTITTV